MLRLVLTGGAVRRLISFDIDGTLEVGDPPGVIPLSAVRRARHLGFVIGSCSDRPISYQQGLWEKHDVPMQFTVLKQQLAIVRADFDVDYYLHIGDTEVDEMMAKGAGFDFLHSIDDDVEAFMSEHQLHP
tara:strand:- start:2824 stop:3213 length:390 start_codon:yes stop_codon:yes gene_type:complete